MRVSLLVSFDKSMMNSQFSLKYVDKHDEGIFPSSKQIDGVCITVVLFVFPGVVNSHIVITIN